jgi:DNA-binding transcriptional LysR family regulator
MDLRRLRYFVAVAEEEHFGRAAARLHMSTPPLSQRIAEFETELGLVLFERTSRKVSLTDAGRRLLDEARLVLRAVERLEQVAHQMSGANPGPVRLKIGFCHGAETIARLAARRFHERHPDIALQPSALTSLRMFDDLATGNLTVGIVRSPIPRPDVLASQLLGRVGFDHLAIPESHPLANRSVIRPADLDGESVLLVSRAEAPTYHDATIGYCAQHGAHPKWMEHSATQVERMLDMVSVGSGIGWLNAFQAQIQHPGVVVVPLQPVTRFDEFHLAWRVDNHSTSVIDFVAIATEVVSEVITEVVTEGTPS